MNVPKLRFKEFNDDYKLVYLENITKLIKDGTHGTHKDVENGIPLLSAKDIYNNKINIPLDARKISKDDYDKIYSKYQLKENDILITIVGTIGRTAIYKKENVAFQRSVATIRLQRDDSSYIRNYLESSAVTTQLFNMTNSSAQGGIYLQSLSKIKLKLPSFNEQIKIGTFLSLLDKKIELQSKKIEALKLYTKKQEKYILDKIKNDTNTFKCNIEDICSIQTGKSNTQDKDENGIYPFYIRSEQVEHSNKYIFDCEAVLTIGDGNIGKVFFYTNGKFDCHQRVYVMNNFSNNILGKYFYYYFSNNFYKRAKLMSAKNTVDSVRQEMISKMNISIPPINKQKEIVKLFDIFENKVNLEISKLSKLELLKKGLMQNMFI